MRARKDETQPEPELQRRRVLATLCTASASLAHPISRQRRLPTSCSASCSSASRRAKVSSVVKHVSMKTFRGGAALTRWLVDALKVL
jgi:hypothetical protein